jgi:acyl carrier protein
MESIEAKVVQVFVEELGAEESECGLAVLLKEDLGFDDLDFVELMMGLEEAFDIEIPDADLEQWRTVGDVILYIGARLVQEHLSPKAILP